MNSACPNAFLQIFIIRMIVSLIDSKLQIYGHIIPKENKYCQRDEHFPLINNLSLMAISE